MQIFKHYGDNVGYELINPTSATGFTAANLTNDGRPVTAAFISVLTHPVRIRMDDTNPTAAAGLYLAAGTQMWITGHENLTNFKAIDTSAGASEVTVLFFQ